MYIIELIIKKIFNKKELPSYNPISEGKDLLADEDYENCEHTFMPIDSTNQVLSCTKCGILKKRNELKKKNIFTNNFFTKNSSN